MTQTQQILQLLREGPKTLGQLRATPVFYEFRSRVSEMRAEGYDIRYHHIRKLGDCKGCGGVARACPAVMLLDACYKLHEEPVRVEANGQLEFA